MELATCFLIFENTELLENVREIVRENFADATMMHVSAVAEIQDSIANKGLVNDGAFESHILITDSRNVVNDVNQSGSYISVLLLSSENDLEPVSQFSPVQVVESFSKETFIAAATNAMHVSHQYFRLKSRAANLDTLADRERKIIAMASEGIPNKTIAVRLGISIKTVEKNRRNAYMKLAVSSTAEMASLVTFGRFFGSFAQ